MSCQGPLAEVVRRVSSVSAFAEKKAVAQMGINSQGGLARGADRHGDQLAYLGFQRDAVVAQPAMLIQHG